MWSFYKTRSFYKGFLIYQKLFFNVFAIIFLCFKEILELEAVLNICGSPLGLGMVFLMQVELQNLMNNNNKKLESNLIRNIIHTGLVIIAASCRTGIIQLDFFFPT